MKKDKLKNNPVDHPAHYTSHPSGIEAIELCGEMDFCLGNAFKYLFRMENKWNPLEDLKKARWYIDRKAYQEGLNIKTQNMIEPHWILAITIIRETHVKDPLILKVVGEKPGNIEKALLYIYIANNQRGVEYRVEDGVEDGGWVEDALQCARYYINRELKKRTRKSSK